MQSEFLLSEDLVDDREAAPSLGCLSVLLFPPFSAALFGALLFFGLSQVKLNVPQLEQPAREVQLASLFSPAVLRWDEEIVDWASEHNLDPNLVATVMQIESCGNDHALSPAGAMGLFQVMPYHFAESEDSYDADTNANRGLNYLAASLQSFGGDAAMALAGYNGGINGASRPQSAWAQETIDYKYWGENIYADALAGRSNSAALEEWYAAGGASLCAQAGARAALP
jgi:soluble lytic murein transglycosylase-like protein